MFQDKISCKFLSAMKYEQMQQLTLLHGEAHTVLRSQFERLRIQGEIRISHKTAGIL